MFVQLTAVWKLAEAQLTHAIRTDPSMRNHAAMFRRSSEIMERIESHSPGSEAELGDMVAFFVKRASCGGDSADGGRELAIAARLMKRFHDGSLPRAAPPVAANDAGPVRRGSNHEPEDLAALVTGSGARLVAIGTNYRYLAVSPANAAFNRSTQIGMMNRHLSEVVGRARFEDRGKPALDRCFAGAPQDYVYPLDVPRRGARLIRCRMDPVRDRAGRLYCALMRMTDVSDEMRDTA